MSRGLDGRGRRLPWWSGADSAPDAEYVAGVGFETVAFDIAGTAIRVAWRRFPASPVHYLVADLLDPPASWRAAFDLVVESHTVQALPLPLRTKAIANVGPMVRPGGTLIVFASARAAADPDPAGPPWPLTRVEVEAFATGDLSATSVEVLADPEDPPERRWRAELRRPATAATGGSAGGGRAAGPPSTVVEAERRQELLDQRRGGRGEPPTGGPCPAGAANRAATRSRAVTTRVRSGRLGRARAHLDGAVRHPDGERVVVDQHRVDTVGAAGPGVHHQPRADRAARGHVVGLTGWAQPPDPPSTEGPQDGLEAPALVGQLVDGPRRRRRQLAAGHEATVLHLAESRGQEVRGDAGEGPIEVGETGGAGQQLADDQQRPALADDVECLSHGAVLAVRAFHHTWSLERLLYFFKLLLEKHK